MLPEELKCKQHFFNTYGRSPEGRYIVRLPFRDKPNLPNSRNVALTFLNRLIAKFVTYPKLKREYDEFMDEYLRVGHMEMIPDCEIDKSEVYYIPHHAVYKNGKIRVVLNASFADKFGISFNKMLLPGPKLQADLRLSIINWRFFRYVVTTDMVKFFRQILIHSSDIVWLRILYVFNGVIQDVRLLTVTYRTVIAPY